ATVGLWILAPEGVELLLGPGWQAVVTPFRILVVTMAFRTSYKLSYTVALSAGGSGAVAMIQTGHAGAVVIGALIGVRWGVAGIARATTRAISVAFGAVSGLALRRVGGTLADLVRARAGGVVTSLVALAALLPAARVLRDLGQPTWIVFVGSVATVAM